MPFNRINELKELIERRQRAVDILKENNINLGTMLSKLNSDSSHFIFELLQNAEDANARKVKFTLTNDKLKFEHDGEVFTLEDIESITNVSNSTKVDKSTKIGQHGLGFKSVFSITKSAIICSDRLEFHIIDDKLPILPVIKNEHSNVKNTEIIIPFNREGLDVKQVVLNIYSKMSNIGLRNILFLNKIHTIEWMYEDNSGIYKRSNESDYLGQSVSKRIISHQNNIDVDSNNLEEAYLVFSEKIDIKGKELQSDIAYQLTNEDGNELITKVPNSKVSVFFETEQETHLNFLIQSMFATTATREQIPLNPEDLQNIKLLDHIGDITANSLEILKKLNLLTTDVLQLMPLEAHVNVISNVIYKKVRDKLLSGAELLPNKFGSFGNNQNTLLTSSWINKLLNEDQINTLFEKSYFVDDCHHELNIYLRDDIGLEEINYKELFNALNKDYFEDQTDKWMIDFYKEIYDISEAWKGLSLLGRKYLIRGEDGKHYNALDQNDDEEIYFYTNNNTHELPSVKQKICEDEQIVEIFKGLGVKEFDELSYIKKYILKYYKEDDIQISSADFRSHIKRIIEYYKKINSDSQKSDTDSIKFLNLLKKRMQFPADFNDAGVEKNKSWAKVQFLYLPDNLIEEYFEDSETSIAYAKQNDLDEIPGYKNLLTKLEVTSLLRPVHHEKSNHQKSKIIIQLKIKSLSSYGDESKDWTFLDLDEILNNIDINKSKLIWKSIVNLPDRYYEANFVYFWYNNTYHANHVPHFINLLKKQSWLYVQGKAYKPSEILFEDLDKKIYNNLNLNEELIELLGFKINTLLPDEVLESLTEKQRVKVELIEKVLNNFTEEELELMNEEKEQEKRKSVEEISKNILEEINIEVKEINIEVEESFNNDESLINSDSVETTEAVTSNNVRVGDEVRSSTFTGIGKVLERSEDGESINVSFNDDEAKRLVTNAANLEKINRNRIENQLKQSIKSDRAQIANFYKVLDKKEDLKTLLNYVDKLPEYDHLWFKLLLNIEYEIAKQNMKDNSILKISFSKVILLNEKLIILKNPSRNAPNYIEDLPSINLIITNKNEKEFVKVDVVSLRDNTIKLKLIRSINISVNEATTAKLVIENPFFLIIELIKEFNNLGLSDDYNHKKEARDEIEFIFGPPGTGKTTELADRINQSIIGGNKKILILTPTNKSADVLCKKIISKANSNFSDWLIRLGNTAMMDDQMQSIVKDREFDIDELESFVVVSTIVRLPYDGFLNIKLNEIQWDDVYFDESSMIHLSYAVYAMKKLNAKKLIFAGDPNQITPIMQYKHWDYQNIYQIFELSDFENPTTKPNDFPVKTLNTQYRSLKDIGDLFSHYAYAGNVESHKTINERKSLTFANEDLKPFTIMRFQINNNERLLKRIRLKHSPYQIYSAIYSIEIAKYISDKINLEWPNKSDKKIIEDDLDIYTLNESKWTIGIICPYKAQSSIIERLIPERKKDDKFIIISGTVHSFQGDECDIVISLFNPPPSISSYISLNNKNIMNVSISRSKQYQILIAPDENIRGNEGLEEMNKIISIIKEKFPDGYTDYKADQIEEIIFGAKSYIRKNSMVSNHQKINRYNESDYRWEVRCDDEAVDIHISE